MTTEYRYLMTPDLGITDDGNSIVLYPYTIKAWGWVEDHLAKLIVTTDGRIVECRLDGQALMRAATNDGLIFEVITK